jgi:hypothetical protein
MLFVDKFWVQEMPEKCVRRYVDEIRNLLHHVEMLVQSASRTYVMWGTHHVNTAFN